MDLYTIFVALCTLVIGIILGRLSMAIQIEVMRSASMKKKMSEDSSGSARNRPRDSNRHAVLKSFYDKKDKDLRTTHLSIEARKEAAEKLLEKRKIMRYDDQDKDD